MPDPAVIVVTGVAPEEIAVICPCALTVIEDGVKYVFAATPVSAIVTIGVVTVPPIVIPVPAVIEVTAVPSDAAVICPCALTVKETRVYDPGVTAVSVIESVGVVPPVELNPVPAITSVIGGVPLVAAVIWPCAFTVIEEFVYDPGVTAVFVIETVAVVVPVTVIPVPATTDTTGVTPLDAAVRRPWASTVKDAYV